MILDNITLHTRAHMQGLMKVFFQRGGTYAESNGMVGLKNLTIFLLVVNPITLILSAINALISGRSNNLGEGRSQDTLPLS